MSHPWWTLLYIGIGTMMWLALAAIIISLVL
jgi:hypothetical protein